MECVMNFPQLWESEFVGDRGEHFCKGEWSFSLGSELGIRKRLLQVSSFQPYLCSLLEGLEVLPGSAFHGLSDKVMGGQGFLSHGKEGVQMVLDGGKRSFGDDGGKCAGFVSHHEEEW